MRRVMLWAAVLWTALAVSAASEETVVVELFTSQGCSSCPPADAMLADFAGSEDVIALALHVDYWDYLGWADRFAQAAFTARQKGYAHAGGWGRVYTPQVVVNGVASEYGTRPQQVRALVAAHAERPMPVAVALSREGGALRVQAVAREGHRAAPCDIHVVRYMPRAEVEILRGENAGRELTYTHIVNRWDIAARWTGQGTFDATLPLAGDEPVVVLVQAPDHGPILGAARLR